MAPAASAGRAHAVIIPWVFRFLRRLRVSGGCAVEQLSASAGFPVRGGGLVLRQAAPGESWPSRVLCEPEGSLLCWLCLSREMHVKDAYSIRIE